jgi:hypothetical protein
MKISIDVKWERSERKGVKGKERLSGYCAKSSGNIKNKERKEKGRKGEEEKSSHQG